MADAIAQLHFVMVNTTDPDRLATFWQGVLGVERGLDMEAYIWLRRQPGAGVGVAFQKVDDPTEGPRRLHLDLEVADLDEAVARATAIGATEVERHVLGDFAWQVMRDPDGNEFCFTLPVG